VLVGKAELPRGASYSSPMPAAENRAGFFRHLVRTADPVLLLHREENGPRWELRTKEGR
jgi:hypothetical protein